MFTYFGRKARIAHLYPPPLHDTIIEPFAGSAAYALHGENWTRDVILVENNKRVAALWRWLITTATEDLIAGLPDLVPGDRLEGSDPWIYMQKLCQASAQDNKTYLTVTDRMPGVWSAARRRAVRDIHKIKHWTVIESDYTSAPDVEATWFIDPPYQSVYGYGQVDTLNYQSLRDWCLARTGQAIVCDYTTASWLPFDPLTARTDIIGQKGTIEGVWLSEPDHTRLFA